MNKFFNIETMKYRLSIIGTGEIIDSNILQNLWKIADGQNRYFKGIEKSEIPYGKKCYFICTNQSREKIVFTLD